MRDTPLRFRAPEQLQDLIKARADRDQLNVSAWIREVLTAASTSPLGLSEIVAALGSDPPPGVNGHRWWKSPNPALGASVLARTCVHRADLIVRYPTFERCLGCNMERQR